MVGQRDILLTIAKTLRHYKTPYILSGSFASSYYGYPRATHDIDLVIQIQPNEVKHLEKALQDLGKDFLIDLESIPPAIANKSIFNILHPASGIKIDFWISKDTDFAASCFKRKRELILNQQKVSIISPEDLILSKLLWYQITPSERQLRDCAGVFKIQEGKLDQLYLSQWADTLHVLDLLGKIGQIDYQPW